LLKRISILYPFIWGFIGQAVVIGSIFFIKEVSWQNLFIIGLIQGLPMGFYWANRNYISLASTQDHERSYFVGLEMALTTLMGVVVPFFYGWIITVGEWSGAYSVDTAYRFLAVIVVISLILGAVIFAAAQIRNPDIDQIILKKVPRGWKWARIQEVFRGMMNASDMFIPMLMVFQFGGVEGSAGTLQAMSALIGSGFFYSLGRKIKVTQRLSLLKFTIWLLLIVTIGFSWFYNWWWMIIFVLGMPVCNNLLWLSLNPIIMKSIDDAEDARNAYAMVADRELFLNIGRVMGILMFLTLLNQLSTVLALRLFVLIMGVSQIGAWWSTHQLVRK
jgi:YQGE family putative transporter